MSNAKGRKSDMSEEKFEVIKRFIEKNPESKAKSKDLKKKFLSAREKPYVFKTSSTVPDDAVSFILKKMKKYKDDELKKISVQHKESMAAENIIGSLLEGYIAQVLEPHGWIHASGNVLKAIDFVKENENGSFIALQIKNRDNTENSSSSAIRAGTEIKKWHRSFASKEDKNWENFPESDAKIKKLLSEEGFLSFIEKELKSE